MVFPSVTSLDRGGTLRTKPAGNESDGKFEVTCDAGRAGQFCALTESLCVQIGRRFHWNGGVGPQTWDSILVTCGRGDDGSLDIQILLFHPDWAEPRQMAFINARLNEKDPDTPIQSVSLGENCEARR